MFRNLFVVILVAAAFGTGAALADTKTTDASTFVHDLGDRAIKILTQKDTGPAVREQKFEKILSTYFDLPVIARFALGRHWREASAEQREDYVALFRHYIAKSYAIKLGGYSGEKFKIVSERVLSNKSDVLVNTRIVRLSGPPINVAWRVRNRKERKVIIDVMVEGVSMAVAQRSEFSSVVRRDGLQGLLNSLRAHTTRASAAK
ncbi:MAG: ABC transporter substrate-binding protein [Rhodospirillaceae bacterium]|jgi:phospholipid transport system substrate-binding protein|nr:ABC transporter substrate-binding protein [Rhodospirillaceae bacterium]MBT5455277.1 ABC transporter substrate-binding protein [Rhodospirillaceae bacterium]